MAPPQQKPHPRATPKCWTAKPKRPILEQFMSQKCPLTKGGCCICNKHLVDSIGRRHPFLSANRNHVSSPNPKSRSMLSQPSHTYEPDVPQPPEPKCQKSIDFFFFFPVLRTLPTRPSGLSFLRGNQQPRQKGELAHFIKQVPSRPNKKPRVVCPVS